MSLTEMSFAQNFVENLGWALLHSLWQGALVALLLACALAALRGASAAARYAAGAAALAAMLAAPALTFVYLDARSAAGGASARSSEAMLATVEAGQSAHDADDEYRARLRETGGAGSAATSANAPARWWSARNVAPAVRWLVFFWLVGVLVHAVKLYGGWRVAGRLKRQGARPLGAAWEESLARLRLQLGVRRAVRLCESALVEVPTLVGWLKPVILVPASALTGLSAPQLEALIVHELAHVRRHDYLVNLLQSAAETLLFYHPAAWWVSRQVRIEREHACDDLAVAATEGGALSYARALATLEQLRAGVASSSPVSLAVGAAGASLVARVRRLVGAPPPARAPRRLTPLAASGLALLALVCVYAGAQHAARGAAVLDDPTFVSGDAPASGRTVAVTFVAVPTFRPQSNSVETTRRATKKLLADMAAHKIRAVGFVGEGQLGSEDNRVREARVDLLRAWLDAGHELGSQSYRHMNLYDTPLDAWKESVVRGESLLRRLLGEREQTLRWFSYPYLNTGPDAETRRAAADFLRGRGYSVHPVTIDSLDFLFANAHQEALRRDDAETARRVAEEYVPYMERMMEFYEGLSRDVFGREIPQVLMLTASPVVADQFDEMAAMLKRRGYRFVTLDEAVRDEAYSRPETYTGEWGVSWLQRWGYTKFGALRREPYLPPYMRQFSKGEGLPPEERKQGRD